MNRANVIDTRIEVMDTLTYEWSVRSNWKHQQQTQ